MRTFARVVEAGSFAAAASQLGVSRAQASKLVYHLEEHLGARLLQRTTRHLNLTQTGRSYYDRIITVLSDIDEAEAEASQQQTEPRGRLRISAPVTFTPSHLVPALAEFLKSYPKIELELELTDRRVELIDEGYDLAIRIGQLQDSSLIARQLAPVRSYVLAAPSYLHQNGEPERPEDLEQHLCLPYTLSREPNVWQFRHDGQRVSVRIHGPVRTNHGGALLTFLEQGLGIGMLPDFICEQALREGHLRTLLDEWEPQLIGVHIVYPSRRALPMRTRTLIDFLGNQFEKKCQIVKQKRHRQNTTGDTGPNR